MAEWSEFEQGLAETLADLPPGAVVVIRAPGGDRPVFVQFCWYERGIHVEIPGDAHLAGSGDRAVRIITNDGWLKPGPHEYNWWTRLSWPAYTSEYRKLASNMVTALRDVYDVPGPDSLVYRAWDETKGEARLELPSLGIVLDPDW